MIHPITNGKHNYQLIVKKIVKNSQSAFNQAVVEPLGLRDVILTETFL